MVYDFTSEMVNDVLHYVRAELGDIDLHEALQEIERSFQGLQTNHTTVKGQLITRLFHRLRSIPFLVTLLEADSIQHGICSPKASYQVIILVSCCRAYAIRQGGLIEDYYLIFWHNSFHLLLGVMTLQINEFPEREFVLIYTQSVLG